MGIKPGRPPKSALPIPPVRPPADESLRFSFKLLDLESNQKFQPAMCRDGYLDRLLCRLRDVSGMTVGEFRTNKSKSLRAHSISWEDTTEPNGFTTVNSQLRSHEPWQFEITRSEHGRVHGILIDNTFYVIWIDPRHMLYGG